MKKKSGVRRKEFGARNPPTPHRLPLARNARYGWIPDVPDFRDLSFMLLRALRLDAKSDLRALCPAVFDQGELGSCTAQALCALLEFCERKQKRETTKGTKGTKAGHVFSRSRLAFYYDEREREGNVMSDSGAMLRTGAKVAAQKGAGNETLWPYIISKYPKKPSQKYYTDAMRHQALTYYRLNQSAQEMRMCLSCGFPFVCGFSVYESFMSARVAETGNAGMPSRKEKLLGGHAVMVVGHDDSINRFIVRNSWGAKWGQKGYFTMPYEYLENTDLAADFWTIRLVE